MIAWLFAMAVHAAEPAPPPITLADAMARSAITAPVRAAGASAEAAAWRRDGAAGARLPTVSLSGDVSVWNDGLEVSFGPSDGEIDCSGVAPPMDLVCLGLSSPIPVRDQVTGGVSVRVVQPLTGLAASTARVHAAGAWVDAAEAGADAAEADARVRAAEAWLDARATEEQITLVQAQVRSLEQRVETARRTLEAHAATRSDVLLAEVALGRAREGLVRTTAMRDLAWRRLAIAVGEPGGALRAADDGAALHTGAPPDEEALLATALATRPEIAALRARVDAADAQVHAASLDRVPAVSAVAVYSHSEGQGFAVPTDAAFVGARLDWTLYAGGRRDAGVHTARAELATAEADLAAASDGVRLQVEAALAALQAARATLEFSDTRIAQAQESLHAMEGRQRAGAATMTEVLGAEADLVDARSSRVAASIEAQRAEVLLEHAVGADPFADLEGP